MAASCFCGGRRAARGQFVKLVFPGGHVELLDRPVLAAEVMARHPRFCVARPDVFREPAGAVAGPDAMLHLGRKYYVVPKSTVRRLLKYSSSHSAGGSGSVSLRRHLQASSSAASGGHDRGAKVGGGKKWFGWAVGTTGDSGDQANKAPQRPPQEGASRGGCSSEGEMVRRVCVKVVKEKGKSAAKSANGGSPGRRRRRPPSPGESASFSWQPSLHSITEE